MLLHKLVCCFCNLNAVYFVSDIWIVFWYFGFIVYCFLLLRCSYKPYAVRSRSTPLSRRMRALWMPSLVTTSANTAPFAYTFELTPSSHETWWKISSVWRLIPTRVHDVDPKQQLNLRRVASDHSAQDDHLNARGSGFILDLITKFILCIFQYRPLHGFSFVFTPQWLAKKQAVINVKTPPTLKALSGPFWQPFIQVQVIQIDSPTTNPTKTPWIF